MPAIGKDLSKIRSHLGFSIQDIQHYTKIPVSTLKSIEDGSIFDHPEENQTYIRSFVRSYGRALKIDDDLMIKALDQNARGNYHQLLLQEYPELAPEKTPAPEQERKTSPDLSKKKPSSEKKPEQKEKKPAEKDQKKESLKSEVTVASTPQEEAKTPAVDDGPSVKSVDWANVGRKISDEKKNTPVWIVALIIILMIVAFVGYFLYENGFFDLGNVMPQEQEQVTPDSETTQSSLSLDLDDSLTAEEENDSPALPSSAVELDDVLQLTVYAAYDHLGPVRVWSDIKPRMDPYWLDQGTAMHFEFRDTIRVRGPYPNLLLFKDGRLLENVEQEFLQQEDDYLELTRDFFSTDTKWSTSVDYELPEDVPAPDSIATRPSF